MKEQVSTLEKGANILLSLMQLNIGGAETHVVELAKELKRKGFNVICHFKRRCLCKGTRGRGNKALCSTFAE